MPVRLLTGTPFFVDGFAINDFETIPDGDITDAQYTFLGTENFNACSFVGPANFTQR